MDSTGETCKLRLIQNKSTVPHSFVIPQRACRGKGEACGHKVSVLGGMRDAALLLFCLLIVQAGEQPHWWKNTKTGSKSQAVGGGREYQPAKNCQSTSCQHLATLGEGRSWLLEGGDPSPIRSCVWVQCLPAGREKLAFSQTQ